MKELFDYYGQTMNDVAYVAAVSFTIKVKEWMDHTDRTIVFLSRYGNLPPEWVEEQDLPRQNRLVRIVGDFLEAQNKVVTETANDSEKEWL